MKYQKFRNEIAKAVKKFRELDKNEIIRVISHLDADGICACSILIHALNLENRRYSISIIPQLTENVIQEYVNEEYRIYFFTDLGSGQLEQISKHLKHRTIFVLDHHQYNQEYELPDNIIHINPHSHEIDGNSEISGSGVVYLFSTMLNHKVENLAHIAIIGAIGDIQEKDGFGGINKEILDKALALNRLRMKKGVRWFGAETKPLHKLLAYSTDPYIPDVSGSPSRAIQFLKNLEIMPKIDNRWRFFRDLTEDEKQRLISAIIIKRSNEQEPEDILGFKYILPDEQEASPTRNAREFSTLLNACGRLDKASLGIGTCLNDKKIKQKAIACLKDYKREIVNAMRWYEDNLSSKHIIKHDKFQIINARDNIRPSIIGTIASILSNSPELAEGTYIMTMAQQYDGYTKVSLRVSGSGENDLRVLIKEITDKAGGEAGGHKNAAGAIIPTDNEQEFINTALRILNQYSIEEVIANS
ncbi:DHH family phosphoesterase [Candidatus Woesearchaeota archaeon]|nr:DHH family phosphoesterase [Candidatus Woesearchaeota archaeon]